MSVDTDAQNRLFKAAEAGELPEFQAAAAAIDGDLREQRAENSANCIHIAAHMGRTELVEYLIDAVGFPIDDEASAGTGSTPLMLAVRNGHVATAELLLARGADANGRGGDAGAAAPLHRAVADRRLDLARVLLTAGADANAQAGSDSPLMLAAARSDAPMLELLLGAGAAVNQASSQGLTPIFVAVAIGGSASCVELLAKAGADVNARALGAFTPLHVAAEGGKAEVVEVLLQAGADADARDEHGHTPARVAGMHGHRAVVQILLQRGGSSAGEAAAGPDGLDAFIQGSKQALQEREARAAGAALPAAGDATLVRVPEPEVADEALADTFKRKGNEFFAAADYEGAAKLYALALSHWTKNATVWSNRAACFLRLERYEQALQDAQIARTLDQQYVKAWYREGRAAEGLRRWEDAATAFYQAAQLQPDNDEFMRLTKVAILEGRRQAQAAAAEPAGAAVGSDAATTATAAAAAEGEAASNGRQ